MHYYMYNQITIYILCMALILHPYNIQNTKASREDLDTPIQIQNFYERSISINCFEKRIEMLPITMVPLFNRVLRPGGLINVDYGRSLFEEMLFCTFIAIRRKWNCGEELIAEQCVWENPQSIMMRGAGVPTEDECPQCDIQNNLGEIACQWTVLQEGLYLNQHDPPYMRRTPWIDHDPLRRNLAAREHLYEFSIQNDINDEVSIICEDKMENPEYLRARSHGDGPAVWRKRLNMLDDLNDLNGGVGGDGTWVCDFLVEATGMHCDGVRVWTPVGVVHPDDQVPPCIDCAWKLTERNILLDMRDCVYDWPVWEPMHEWVFFDDMSE